MSSSVLDPATLEKIKSHYNHSDPSHDWSHIQRVVHLCTVFAEELQARKPILLSAAYLHDVVNVPKNHSLREQASQLAADRTRTILSETQFSTQEIEEIAQVVLEHSYSANLKATSLESEILQDADKLDGMGAIGVMRWVTCGTKMKASYYHPTDPWAERRELDDKAYSLDHFKTKLLNLYERLNTDPGRREGLRRLEFFQSFLKQLSQEIRLG